MSSRKQWQKGVSSEGIQKQSVTWHGELPVGDRSTMTVLRLSTQVLNLEVGTVSKFTPVDGRLRAGRSRKAKSEM